MANKHAMEDGIGMMVPNNQIGVKARIGSALSCAIRGPVSSAGIKRLRNIPVETCTYHAQSRIAKVDTITVPA